MAFDNKKLGIIEWITILGAIFGSFAWLNGEIRSLDQKLEKSFSRTDRLYEMYAETQKEIKEIYREKR